MNETGKDIKIEETENNSKSKIIGVREISPNYFITSMAPNKFTKGIYFGSKVVLGRTFKSDLDGKIRIYEDRVKGWFLDHAKTLVKEQHADFVVLMICTSYLEGNQQFKEGMSTRKGKGSEMIKRALKRIFPMPKEAEWVFDTFVDTVRNGLFHNGMTKELVSFNRDTPNPFSISKNFEGMILINPILFLWEIEEDFKEYIGNLKNPNNKKLRENFEKHWEERHKFSN